VSSPGQGPAKAEAKDEEMKIEISPLKKNLNFEKEVVGRAKSPKKSLPKLVRQGKQKKNRHSSPVKRTRGNTVLLRRGQRFARSRKPK